MNRFRCHLTHPTTIGCWFAATSVATITGPFGTYSTMTPELRLMYWAGLILVSIIVAFLVRVAIVVWLPPMSRTARDLSLPIMFAAVFTPILEFVNHGLLAWPAHEQTMTGVIFLFNVIVAGSVALVRRSLNLDFVAGRDDMRPTESRRTEQVKATEWRGERPRLYARIGGDVGRRIQRLMVDDHYVIVGFDDGSEQRLLMRFADAVREMEGQDGFLTHRSHWVSADAVVRVSRSGGRDVLELIDGSSVPVSRTNRPTLEARGLILVEGAERATAAE